MSNPKPCPICKRPRETEFAPFCSQRCKDRDLAQWFG
ncbi:MAG: DNA gyrase inhibitor YacG, partial [Pseudomonadota bacterium]